jgi:phosphoribosylamine--glycine ligase / phosphoribosylformylglycinamidine cyclo-ligase
VKHEQVTGGMKGRTANVLLVGSGGREHALAWKLAQSPHLVRLWITPGNAGTSQVGENLPILAEDAPALVNFATSNPVDLVIIGPEAPLADGLSDDLRRAGVRVFGPSRAAAQIEASKAYAKDFMQRHDIPTARYATFSKSNEAITYLHGLDYPVVIKASGLAAGKGVIVPETRAEAEASLRSILENREFGAAGSQVVIEERLSGEEVSLLAFTDGQTVRSMPPAQDHKRLLDGDRGPNTGGMGAYAPAVICPPELVAELVRTVLQPAVDGLRLEGFPFVGVLYAGLMLTDSGPRLLEFNCRFGDPETQVILPLLESDLLEIAIACADGSLEEEDIRWKNGAAACVVLASEGYPGKYSSGRVIHGLDEPMPDACVFHAGTKCMADQMVTAGGRVLGVTGLGKDIPQALMHAYDAVRQISFEGMQYRRDIGGRAIGRREVEEAAISSPAYLDSGVSIDSGDRAVELMSTAVRSTYGPQVLAGIGSFGGLFDAAEVKAMRQPVLVASTDGVGTKVKLAAQVGRYASIGQDIVNHCINDILVQGARPLFFLDYFASSRLKPEVVAEVVAGIATACREAGCALIGGETAEMPGVYAEGEFDLAGTIIGVVEHECILPHAGMGAGDILLGIGSSGPHTNGYSLIRKIFADVPLDTVFPEIGIPLAEALLAPHRSYLPVLHPIISTRDAPIWALVHLTGGGFMENIPRVLPEGLGAVIGLGNWPVPPLFRLIQQRGGISQTEMYRVFNMGIGMIAIIAPQAVDAVRLAIPEETWIIGELVSGKKHVSLV